MGSDWRAVGAPLICGEQYISHSNPFLDIYLPKPAFILKLCLSYWYKKNQRCENADVNANAA